MQFVADPELRTKALLELRLEYGMDVQRPGLHQSQLTHCLTQTYWDKTDPAPPNDKQVLLFAIGFMFERVILSREETPGPIEIDGITMSLDTVGLFGPADIKSTRMRAAGRKGAGGFQPPSSWEYQFKTYRYALNQVMCWCGHRQDKHNAGPYNSCSECAFETNNMACNAFEASPSYDFGVVVLHLVEPEITAWRYTFTQEELESNWNYLLQRKNQLQWMLAHEDPQPFKHNQSYECETCNHSLKCGLLASVQSLQKPSNVMMMEEYR
jgi:hypothetical protein